MKSNKSISIFCNFKNGQKSIFELEKSFKLPEMQFHEKKSRHFFRIRLCLSGLYHHKSESAAETVNVMIDSHFATAALEI